MLIDTQCTNCDAVLKAPEAVLGKRVKCKKCGEAFVARLAGDEEDLPKTVKMNSPAKRKSSDEDEIVPKSTGKKPVRKSDDDDEEPELESVREVEDDDEPKPKAKKKGKGKKGKKKQQSPMMLYVLIGVGALVLLGGGAVGTYYGFIKDDDKPTNTGTGGGTSSATTPPAGAPSGPSSTAGWIDFSDDEGRYKVKFPKQPKTQTVQRQTAMGPVTIKMNVSDSPNEAFMSLSQPVPDKMGRSDDDILIALGQVAQAQIKGGSITSQKSMTYQNLPAREVVIKMQGKEGNAVFRYIMASDRVIMLMAGGETATPESPRVKAFFESLKIE